MENKQDFNGKESQDSRSRESENRKEESISEVSSQGHTPKSEADDDIFKQNQLGLDDNNDDDLKPDYTEGGQKRGNDIRNTSEADEQIKGSDADYYEGRDINASEMNK